MIIYVFDRIETIVGKGGNAGYTSLPGSLKLVNVW